MTAAEKNRLAKALDRWEACRETHEDIIVINQAWFTPKRPVMPTLEAA